MKVHAANILPLTRNEEISVPVKGVGGIFSFLFGGSDLQAQSQASDQALIDDLKRKHDAGLISDDVYAQSMAHLNQQVADTATIPAQIDAAGAAGLQEGYQNELSAVTTIVKTPFSLAGDIGGSILKGIPWWIWAGGALYLFLHLGGGGYVERHARAALSK